jgi:hypothetical protein
MMIDFEDREPGPAMSLGARAFLALLVVLTIYGLFSQAAFAWSLISSLFA